MTPHAFFEAFGIGFGWAAGAWWVAIFLQSCSSDGHKGFPTWRYAVGWALFGLFVFCLSAAFGLEIE